jgi:predicted site-specific integrase-resolvase
MNFIKFLRETTFVGHPYGGQPSADVQTFSNYLEILLKKNGIEIEVVNCVQDEKEDLIQDFVSIITSFSARIYGQRRSKRKTEQLIKELEIKESINSKNQ